MNNLKDFNLNNTKTQSQELAARKGCLCGQCEDAGDIPAVIVTMFIGGRKMVEIMPGMKVNIPQGSREYMHLN